MKVRRAIAGALAGGNIVSVEAMGAFIPYGTKSGWIE